MPTLRATGPPLSAHSRAVRPIETWYRTPGLVPSRAGGGATVRVDAPWRMSTLGQSSSGFGGLAPSAGWAGGPNSMALKRSLTEAWLEDCVAASDDEPN